MYSFCHLRQKLSTSCLRCSHFLVTFCRVKLCATAVLSDGIATIRLPTKKMRRGEWLLLRRCGLNVSQGSGVYYHLYTLKYSNKFFKRKPTYSQYLPETKFHCTEHPFLETTLPSCTFDYELPLHTSLGTMVLEAGIKNVSQYTDVFCGILKFHHVVSIQDGWQATTGSESLKSHHKCFIIE